MYKEIFEYCKTKLRVVFPWYHKFHEAMMARAAHIRNLGNW